MARIAFISDTHGAHGRLTDFWERSGHLDQARACDLVVHCGDGTMRGRPLEVEAWLNWMGDTFDLSVVVPGNHDFLFETERERAMAMAPDNVVVLIDAGYEHCGVRLWGSPVTPWFHDWAFNRRGRDILPHWEAIPADTDVLVTHGPPMGVLDRLARPNVDGTTNPGCPFLRDHVRRVTPRVHAFGHIHEGRGMFEDHGTTFVNVSCLDERYRPKHPPVILDV